MSLTKEELRELVEKEVASSAAREVLAELGPKQESYSKLLRHPLLLALIATIIGWSYDGVVKEREAKKLAAEIEITEADRREDSAIAKLNEFVALAHTRSIATDLLRSALKREAGVEAVEKKKALLRRLFGLERKAARQFAATKATDRAVTRGPLKAKHL